MDGFWVNVLDVLKTLSWGRFGFERSQLSKIEILRYLGISVLSVFMELFMMNVHLSLKKKKKSLISVPLCYAYKCNLFDIFGAR